MFTPPRRVFLVEPAESSRQCWPVQSLHHKKTGAFDDKTVAGVEPKVVTRYVVVRGGLVAGLQKFPTVFLRVTPCCSEGPCRGRSCRAPVRHSTTRPAGERSGTPWRQDVVPQPPAQSSSSRYQTRANRAVVPVSGSPPRCPGPGVSFTWRRNASHRRAAAVTARAG